MRGRSVDHSTEPQARCFLIYNYREVSEEDKEVPGVTLVRAFLRLADGKLTSVDQGGAKILRGDVDCNAAKSEVAAIWQASSRFKAKGPKEGDQITECKLDFNQYYGRMVRPALIGFEPVLWEPHYFRHFRPQYSSSIAEYVYPESEFREFISFLQRFPQCSGGQIASLKQSNQRRINSDAYGHDIRDVILLACTEVEALWKSTLVCHGFLKKRMDTRDYVRLAAPEATGVWRKVLIVSMDCGFIPLMGGQKRESN